MDEKCILVLYGSQTGNSEGIAIELARALTEQAIKNRCANLNDAVNIFSKDEVLCMIIICSTTGNGDSPENCSKWWRMVKNRNVTKTLFADIPYCVLGLGDTNYDKFCFMGKAIDKRVTELGGSRILPLYCADEGTDLSAVVEMWKVDILRAIQQRFSSSVLNQLEQYTNVSLERALTSDNNNSKNISPTNEPLNEVKNHIPGHIQSLLEVSRRLNTSGLLTVPPTAASMLRVKLPVAEKSPFILELGVETVRFSPFSSTPTSPMEWTVENPYHATVVDATMLSRTDGKVGDQWGEARNVISVELALDNSGIVYSPGDSIAVCCPNAAYAVDIVLQKLRLTHNDPNLGHQTVVKCTADGSFTTLGELFNFKYDLMGPPKKGAVALLAEYCSDAAEKIQLQHLCSKPDKTTGTDIGKQLWQAFLESQSLGIAELLHLFPSCTPQLHQLLGCLTPLVPRYYSIASSPLVHPQRLTFAFSLVKYTCKSSAGCDAPIRRQGLCTSYIESLVRSFLHPRGPTGCPTSSIKLRVFHKATVNFHMPSSVAYPLILVGPGTGVAPFIGFLQHRCVLECERRKAAACADEDCCTGMWRGGFDMDDLPAEGGALTNYIHSVEPGPVHLFFGCRNDCDFLFRTELEEFQRNGTLTTLEVAQSRVGPEKVYVTHKILLHAAELASLIMDENAHIFVCGDGNHMAKDVFAAFKSIIVAHCALDEEEVEGLLQEMKLRKKYVVDIWS